MKKITTYLAAVLVTLSAFVTPSFGQQTNSTTRDVSPARLWKQGNQVHLKMQLDQNSFKVKRDRTLTITPVLVSGSNSKEFPYVIVNGKERHKVYKRAAVLSKAAADNALFTEEKAIKDSKIQYEQAVAYEPWMEKAHLDLREDWCNCGKYDQETIAQRVIGGVEMDKKPDYTVKPRIAYIQPKVEAGKTQNMEWEVYLDFRVNKTDVLPEFMNNQAELAKIQSMLEQLSTDKHIEVTQIDIIGYASPEGSSANNERLSKGRAENLKSYLVKKSYFSPNVYKVQFGGENWDGLISALGTSTMTDRSEITSLINSTSNRDVLKKSLQTFKGGAPYRDMLTNIYPKLRKVVCQVNYNVQNFNLAEAKEVLKTQPKYLSVSEFYQIASSYPEGSAEQVAVYEAMMKMFPNDESANLNAAADALSRKDLTSAKRYLDKANKNSSEYANNMGVYYILQGDMAKAKEVLGKSNTDEAKHNLQEVTKKLESLR